MKIKSSKHQFISIKNYTPFFTRLYSLSYLDKGMSEKALELLVAEDFAQGISSAVSLAIKVAQKFGHNRVFEPETKEIVSNDLHDCGIVYYPQHPYLLCIMTKGKDFNNQAKAIQNISALVYQEMRKKQLQVAQN